MQRFSVNNLQVLYEKKDTDSVTVQVTVLTGSNNEKPRIRGISHLIEHMLFEGTTNRQDAKTISNEIESLGGEINAFTNNIRTAYYIKVPKQHVEKAFDIISDIIINPIFKSKSIEKERKVILKEINIFNDESRHYQWILFLSSLFKTHPAKYPAYGTKKDVKTISRKKILEYYRKYYNASNSILSIVGNVKNPKKLVGKYFDSFKTGKKVTNKKYPIIPNKKTIKKVTRKIMNSYLVFGYKTTPRLHRDSYILDVIQAILGRGQSGKMFDTIRNKHGLAYEVGCHHEPSHDFGYFTIYLSCDKSKIQKALKLIFQEFDNLQSLIINELSEAKTHLAGRYILDNEDTRDKADSLSFWQQIKDASLQKDYLHKIKKVTIVDIKRVAKKYFSKNYTMAVIEQST